MTPSSRKAPDFGALIISLDFELHWGVRDHATTHGPYKSNLLGARTAIPKLLRVFEESRIRATWATVGFLMARTSDELAEMRPSLLPNYFDSKLSPYGEAIGRNETEDPLHFAPSVVDQIIKTPGQELATHTYSHYYCLEPGSTAEAFAADIASAKRIATNFGVEITTIVFPRNQHNAEYDCILQGAGINVYRGNADSWMYKRWRLLRTLARAARLIDSLVPIRRASVSWSTVPQASGLYDVAASIFVRPAGNMPRALRRLHALRLKSLIREAAQRKRIAHLWWHPHNFGVCLEDNLVTLQEIIATFHECADKWKMRSLTMREAAQLLHGE